MLASFVCWSAFSISLIACNLKKFSLSHKHSYLIWMHGLNRFFGIACLVDRTRLLLSFKSFSPPEEIAIDTWTAGKVTATSENETIIWEECSKFIFALAELGVQKMGYKVKQRFWIPHDRFNQQEICVLTCTRFSPRLCIMRMRHRQILCLFLDFHTYFKADSFKKHQWQTTTVMVSNRILRTQASRYRCATAEDGSLPNIFTSFCSNTSWWMWATDVNFSH